jgi:biopolymer transport protein ExbD
MRIPSPFRDRRTGVDLQLTPMIDCVFLLMVYFLWSSSFAVVEMSLPSSLSAKAPSSAGSSGQPPPSEADFDEVVIRVLLAEGGPRWDINGAPVASLAQMRQTLTTIADIKRDAPVVIDPVGDVPLGDVIDVFDLTRLVGFEKVQFATEARGQ